MLLKLFEHKLFLSNCSKQLVTPVNLTRKKFHELFNFQDWERAPKAKKLPFIEVISAIVQCFLYLVQLFDQNKSSLNKSNFLPDSNQIQSFLIVNEFNMMPIDCFQIVFFLFQFENVLDEKLLKIFVGKIDAKLLKRIGVEIFKTKNIQNANTCSINVFDSRVLFVNGCVDLFHNVDE